MILLPHSFATICRLYERATLLQILANAIWNGNDDISFFFFAALVKLLSPAPDIVLDINALFWKYDFINLVVSSGQVG